MNLDLYKALSTERRIKTRDLTWNKREQPLESRVTRLRDRETRRKIATLVRRTSRGAVGSSSGQRGRRRKVLEVMVWLELTLVAKKKKKMSCGGRVVLT